MSIRIYAITAAAALVVMFAFAASWHLFVFKGLYDRLAIYTRTEPIVPLGLLSMALQALIFAYLFPIFAEGRSPVAAGLGFGLLMGVLMGILTEVLKAPGWLFGFSTQSSAFALVLHIFGQGHITVGGENGGVPYEVPMIAFAIGTAFWTILGFAVAWYRYTRLRVTR